MLGGSLIILVNSSSDHGVYSSGRLLVNTDSIARRRIHKPKLGHMGPPWLQYVNWIHPEDSSGTLEK